MICYRLMDAIKTEYNFVVYHDATDEVADDVWLFTSTEEEAQKAVVSETENYDNDINWQFHYSKISRS